MESEQVKINELEKRLKYATKLIELMGKEIVQWTPSYKRKKAIEDLAGHLDIVNGKAEI